MTSMIIKRYSNSSNTTFASGSTSKNNMTRSSISSGDANTEIDTGVSPTSVSLSSPKQSSNMATTITAATTNSNTNTVNPNTHHSQDRRVCYIRILMISTLVTVAAVVAYFAGTYVASDEISNFELQYDDYVAKVAHTFQQRINRNHDVVKTFSAMITSRYGIPEARTTESTGASDSVGAISGSSLTTWNYNVTIPDFQEQTAALLTIADGRALSFNPIITQNTDRIQWEAHATHSAWILGSSSLIHTPISKDSEWPDNRTVSFGIYSSNAEREVIYDPGHQINSTFPNVLVPVWQIAPILGNEKAVMYNLHSERNRMLALDHMMEHKVPALTALLQLVQDGNEKRPSSILFYPVFDTFHRDDEDASAVNQDNDAVNKVESLTDETTGEQSKVDGEHRTITKDEPSTSAGPKVVGSVSIVFSWDTLLHSIMPDYIKGMVCVLQSSTGQVFSYKLSGDTVTLLGEGDLHDTKYDKYGRHVKANLGQRVDIEVAKEDFIAYALHIYPSNEFEAQYVTNKSRIIVVGVVLIFLFTSVLFGLYDYLVESRQQRTARLARQTGHIVDSMFPAAFRDRLYSIHGSNGDLQRRRSSVFDDSHRGSSSPSAATSGVGSDGQPLRRASTATTSTANRGAGGGSTVEDNEATSQQHQPSPCRRSLPKRLSTLGGVTVKGGEKLKQIDKFMKGVRTFPTVDNPLAPLGMNVGCLDGEPIAELFTDTSIMFSDIVGFTKWSSERSPNEVFRLLEQIFWEFDDLAAQHNVFKLGTIGDCYIAVTGIPDPIADHAIVLTQFAFDARDKVREVCHHLEREGLDTAKLDMRFGVHSGATTAGILRGTKSRFELFGDTINTASRMESTGLGGKIQVSEETAELIRRDGKPRWLIKRDTMITAKGKGQLQTYWAEPQRAILRVSFSEKMTTFFMDNNFHHSSRMSQSDICDISEENVEDDADVEAGKAIMCKEEGGSCSR